MSPSSSSGTRERQIAALVRGSRREKGWSQERLATRSGFSRQTISTLEKDGTGTISTLLAVLAALGISEFPINASSRDLTRDSPTADVDIEEIRRYVSNAAHQLEQIDSVLRQRGGAGKATKGDRSKRSATSVGRGRVNEQEGNQFLASFGDLDRGQQMEFLRNMAAQIRSGGETVEPRASITHGSESGVVGVRAVARRRRG